MAEWTSPKGFLASKFDVGNGIFSKLYNFFEILFGIFLDFCGECFGTFLEFLGDFFGNFLEDFCEDFLREMFWGDFLGGGIFLGGVVWEEFFVYIVKVIWIWKGLISLSRFWVLSRFCLNAQGRKEEEF